jgi:hypothetical protein
LEFCQIEVFARENAEFFCVARRNFLCGNGFTPNGEYFVEMAGSGIVAGQEILQQLETKSGVDAI